MSRIFLAFSSSLRCRVTIGIAERGKRVSRCGTQPHGQASRWTYSLFHLITRHVIKKTSILDAGQYAAISCSKGMAYMLRGSAYAYMGEFDRALQASTQARAIGATIEDRSLQSHAPMTRANTTLPQLISKKPWRCSNRCACRITSSRRLNLPVNWVSCLIHKVT